MLVNIVKKSRSKLSTLVLGLVLFAFCLGCWAYLSFDLVKTSQWRGDVCKIKNIVFSEVTFCYENSDNTFPCITVQYSGTTQNGFEFSIFKTCKSTDTKCLNKYNLNEILDCRYKDNVWEFGNNVFYNKDFFNAMIIITAIFSPLFIKLFICDCVCYKYVRCKEDVVDNQPFY